MQVVFLYIGILIVDGWNVFCSDNNDIYFKHFYFNFIALNITIYSFNHGFFFNAIDYLFEHKNVLLLRGRKTPLCLGYRLLCQGCYAANRSVPPDMEGLVSLDTSCRGVDPSQHCLQ